MSSYEDYDKTSGHYDKTRIPIGVEIILGCLVKSGRALNQMKVLEAGCGTGNYPEALLAHSGENPLQLNQTALDAHPSDSSFFKTSGFRTSSGISRSFKN